ncbi:Isotrichodermin C-15 hydroxylase [Tolypocladium capitatum]|uniref:Isotrichodermin C-15 hydroxylase n=1 Tax=Tolypocladium capitatum TaxID=45235 RepID=A0A2K3QBV9_9HYPO|nr:Isotrichodermin C-15 hydroxylase [Tolypocladium capitatum]
MSTISGIRHGFDAVLDSWNNGNLSRTFGLVFALVVAYGLATVIYRIWFHPLSKFPGPPLLSATYMPFAYSSHVQGTWVRKMLGLHRKYGPAVRIGPDHIALDGTVAWSEVYGHRSGKQEFQKQTGVFVGDTLSLISAPRDTHRRQRRQVAHAFSNSALNQQEPIIRQYIDLLISRLDDRAREGRDINVVEWMNFTTFDIIGDLAFSEPFHSLKNHGYHPWILSIIQSIRGGSIIRFLHIYPSLAAIVNGFNLSSTTTATNDVREHCVDKARARMKLGEEPVGGRRDFMSYMMRKTRDGGDGMSEAEILAGSSTLTIAGSETTATLLSGFFFYVSRNPRVYALVADQVRSAFATEEEITMRSTASLDYVHACIEETLRIYPPVAENPVRISHGDTIDGKFVPAGTLISVYQWPMYNNPDYFADPDSFVPERWFPETHPRHDERFQADNREIFKPFSHGPRDCIGKNLAYAEIRLIITRVLYRFDVELAFKQDDWHEKQKTFLVWEKGPLYIRLTPRTA